MIRLFLLSVAVGLLVATGCAKTIPTESIDDGFALCKAIAPGPGAACVGQALRFKPSDPQAIYRMEFEHASAPIVLTCLWRDPSDAEYLRTGAVHLTAQGYRERAVLACPLPIAGHPPSVHAGRWTLEVYYDGGERTREHRDGLLREVEVPIG